MVYLSCDGLSMRSAMRLSTAAPDRSDTRGLTSASVAFGLMAITTPTASPLQSEPRFSSPIIPISKFVSVAWAAYQTALPNAAMLGSELPQATNQIIVNGTAGFTNASHPQLHHLHAGLKELSLCSHALLMVTFEARQTT